MAEAVFEKPPDTRQRELITVDRHTGEVVDGVVAVVQRRKRYYDGKDYAIVFLEALQAVAMDRELGVQEHRVLTYMMSKIGFENDWKNLNQSDIARDLQMRRQHVNRAIGRLTEKGLIVKGPRVGRGHVYGLNPHIAWRGASDKHKTAKILAPPLQLLQGGRTDESVERTLMESGAPTMFEVE